MSSKTIKQRIAVVAVSALTAGLLSVVATPAANAVTGTLVGRVYENITNDGTAVASVTTGANGSQGLISVSAAVSGAQTVSMHSNGVIVVATSDVATAQKITITGGGLLARHTGSADCYTDSAGALTYTGTSPAATAAILAANAGGGQLFCPVRATKPGTAITITIDEDTSSADTSDAVITVNVLNSAYNAANGGASVNSATNTSQRSQGVIAWGTGTGLSQTATMFSNGTLSTQTALVGSSLAQIITVTGGVLAGADKCLAAGGTLGVAADLTNCSVTANAASQLFANFKPSAAGTALVITGYNDATTAGYVASWKITVTVVAVASSGAFSASKSNIALTAAGSAPSTANVDTAGVSTVENATCAYLYYSLLDANSVQLPTSTSIVAKVSTGLTVGIGASGTIGVATGSYGGAATYLQACQATANTAATGTMTLTVNGVDVATRTITIVGQLASITVVEVAIAKRNEAGTTDSVYGDFSTRNAGTWYPSHTYTAKDAAGNLVPADISIEATSLDAQVTALGDDGTADPRNADSDLRTGGLTFACADTSGANTKVQVKATATDTTSIKSNTFTVTCAGDAVNYTASTDKAVYNTGDVMTVTVKGTDKSGKTANDYGIISTTAKLGTIASGAIASSVNAPADGNTLTAGVKTYKYIIGQTPGTYTISVDFPNVNNTTYNQSALTLPVSVKSATTDVSNADVLKSIVSLIASINKQIQALQKLILKR
jgi:hypothetical protein